jgi:D-glycero-alpha-D-manno-heptose-7-phosphate kinase
MSRAGWAVAEAPLRICDAGGWTDTWFAGHGVVCTLAAGPGVRVRVERSAAIGTVELVVPGFGDRYSFALGDRPGRHPLLEATLGRWARPGDGLVVDVRSHAPLGLGAGGSAAVVVALVAALQALTGDVVEPDEIALAAFEVETVELGWQSGVQDQLAAVHGGANVVVMDAYPRATVRRLDVDEATWERLDERLVTVYLGRPHRSSDVHDRVIARLESDASARAALEPLRVAAREAVEALEAGDLDGYACSLVANTAAQAALDPALVSDLAHGVIERARRTGAIGWKVNGAGGEGGSVSLLAGDDPGGLRRALGDLAGVTVLTLRPWKKGLVVTSSTRS